MSGLPCAEYPPHGVRHSCFVGQRTHQTAAVQGQVVNACKLQIVFIPGEISFEVSRLMPDKSKMIKHSGVIELDGEKQLDHINAYIEDLREYGISD